MSSIIGYRTPRPLVGVFCWLRDEGGERPMTASGTGGHPHTVEVKPPVQRPFAAVARFPAPSVSATAVGSAQR